MNIKGKVATRNCNISAVFCESETQCISLKIGLRYET
jgi:hypothetical protein